MAKSLNRDYRSQFVQTYQVMDLLANEYLSEPEEAIDTFLSIYIDDLTQPRTIDNVHFDMEPQTRNFVNTVTQIQESFVYEFLQEMTNIEIACSKVEKQPTYQDIPDEDESQQKKDPKTRQSNPFKEGSTPLFGL